MGAAGRTGFPFAASYGTEGVGFERIPLPYPAGDVYVSTAESQSATGIDVELRTSLLATVDGGAAILWSEFVLHQCQEPDTDVAQSARERDAEPEHWKIENTGVELQAAYRINRAWSVDGNYSYLHMAHPVIAAPEHKFYVGGNFSQGRWNVSTGLQYIAGLYTQTDPVATEDFVLWNVRASFRATRWLDIWARGENLLAQRYEINAGYPMPRATVMAGVNLNF